MQLNWILIIRPEVDKPPSDTLYAVASNCILRAPRAMTSLAVQLRKQLGTIGSNEQQQKLDMPLLNANLTGGLIVT